MDQSQQEEIISEYKDEFCAIINSTNLPNEIRTEIQTKLDFVDVIFKYFEDAKKILETMKPIYCHVKGVFYAHGKNPDLAINQDDTLTLRRQPGNEHDSNAVEVLASCGTKLGYLPRDIALNLAKYLDDGYKCTATVVYSYKTQIDIELYGPAVTAYKRKIEIVDDDEEEDEEEEEDNYDPRFDRQTENRDR